MKIKVTQQDIDYGTQQSCSRCPIALAINRLSCVKKVLVSSTTIMVYVEDSAGDIYRLPDEACSFVDRFDNGKFVMPFEFDIPDWEG